MRFPLIFAVALMLAASCTQQPTAPPPATAPASTAPVAIDWQPWSPDVFARAKASNKLVLLDLHAVWCHWCHVMDETTYREPAVARLIAERYIAVGVDADSRPDLANRYENYGWPATVVFNSDGSELAKRRGYLPPEQMASMLQAFIDDPTPGPSAGAIAAPTFTSDARLAPDLQTKLSDNIRQIYDAKNAGWGTGQKFVDAEVLEYCMMLARHGDANAEHMARETLTANLKLLDPAWGGVYQYSTDGDWDHPHFEKIMSYQADDMRTYARASVIWHDPAYLSAAESIHRYLRTFLTSPDGAFYTSQDADRVPGEHGGEYFKLDAARRRALGIPRIDTHIYSRENGWAIEALVALHAATNRQNDLDEAIAAANWILNNRNLNGGGFRHDATDSYGPYLADTHSMGRAFLALYSATADRVWLTRADNAATFIEQHFPHSGTEALPAGILTTIAPPGGLSAEPEFDENVSLARFANLLFAYTGKPEHRKLAETAMRYIVSPQVAGFHHWEVGGILLANAELAAEPLHITVVASKHDAAGAALFQTASAWPVTFKRVEWFDPAEGALPRGDVEYPQLPTAAAFTCTGTACSSPVKTVEALATKLKSAN